MTSARKDWFCRPDRRACTCALGLSLLFSLRSSAHAQAPGILGTWKEPGGAVIMIEPCSAGLCARLSRLPTGAPARDSNNPDPALRNRPLCGLAIGQGFRTSDSDHASGGKLYDPKNGKTYSGTMTLRGNELQLRGYIGLKMFGRTETWQRVAPVPSCGT